ncbi:MAG: hypothetical protein K2O92_02850 [Lachnospiraceae bacterium]|nr:hypothetical protein [Lachnospiraceae bacterium]
MRLTKNVKKILAATLSMALVVSGVTVGTKQAKAADALKWTGSFAMEIDYAAKATEVKTDAGSTIELKGNDYNSLGIDFKADLSAFTDPVVTVIATETTDGAAHNFAVCKGDWSVAYAGNNEDSVGVPSATTTITGKLDKSVSEYVITAPGRTVSSVTITDGGTTPDTSATTAPADATATPVVSTDPTAAPVAAKGSMDKFSVNFNYVADDTWAESIWEGTPVEVTGNGSYSISYTATSATQSIFMLFLETNLYKGALKDGFSMVATDVTVGSKNYKVSDNGGWCFKDEKEDEQYRYNIVNPYNGPKKADGLTDLTEGQEKKINEIGTVPVAAGDVVTVYFTVKGMNSDNAGATATPGGVPAQTAAPEATVTPGVTTAPAVTAVPAETTAPTTAPSEATPTPDAVQTPAPDNTDDTDNTDEEEASLTVAKKTVSIKAGKSVTVKYTATNADGDAVKAKATSANKKVAKVKVSSKKAIKITVPKNVKKGKKAVVTVKAAGKTAKIKVKVK